MCIFSKPPPPEKPPAPRKDPVIAQAKGDEAKRKYRGSGYSSTVLATNSGKKTTTG